MQSGWLAPIISGLRVDQPASYILGSGSKASSEGLQGPRMGRRLYGLPPRAKFQKVARSLPAMLIKSRFLMTVNTVLALTTRAGAITPRKAHLRSGSSRSQGVKLMTGRT